MRIYIFSPHYPPQINPRSFRVKALIKLCFTQGHEVYLNKKHIESLSELSNKGTLPKSKIKNLIKTNFGFLLRFVFPDHYVFWSKNLIRNSEDLWRHKPGDIMITISNPMSCHLIGLAYKKINPTIFWIADVGDHFSKNAAQHFSKRLFTKQAVDYEKLIFNICDIIVFNNTGVANVYVDLFPNINAKLKIIENPINVDFTKIKPEVSSKIRLSYFGNTYKPTREGIQEICFFEKIIIEFPALLTKLQFCFVGDFHKEFIKKLKSSSINAITTIQPQKQPEDIISFYSKTDILINFTNSSYNTLPSKLIEYKASGFPILNFDLHDTVIDFLIDAKRVHHVNLKQHEYAQLFQFIINSKDKIARSSLSENNFEENYIKLIN